MKNEREKNGKTILLYETDGLLTGFDATTVETGTCTDTGREYVVLDRTAFFPEGGGQKADTGILETKDGIKAAVTDVRTVGGVVRHYVDRHIDAGVSLHGKIDEIQRFSRMQNHGAEHLISGLIHKRFGYDNVGFHMSEGELVIDINGPITPEEIRDIEEEANRVVFENVPITVSFPTREEAAALQYRSKLDIEEGVRLVTIEGYDVCACCAPHLDCTGRFGVIKILDMVPHRQGVRITMIAGMDAYADYAMLHARNSKIMELLSAGRNKTASYVEEALSRYAALKEEMSMLKKTMAENETRQAIDRIKSRAGAGDHPELIFSGLTDPVGLRNLVNECTKVCDGPVCAFMKDGGNFRYIFAVRDEMAQSFDLRKLVKEFNEECMGRGGGSNIMAQGSCAAQRARIEEFFAK